MRAWKLGAVALICVLIGVVQHGMGEEYGGVSLKFFGHLTTAGSCQQVAENMVRCRVPAGVQGTLMLQATVTPSVYVVHIHALTLPGWASFQPASGYGTASTTCTFLPPPGAVGKSFQLRFRASTVYGLFVDLTVILEVVAGGPPRTDSQGRFSVPIEYLPNTSVTGVLTRCGVQPLPGVTVTVELLPKPGREVIRDLGDIGAVRISSPGYGEAVIKEFRLLSSIDIYGQVHRTIDVGTVCLQPVEPTEPISGTTDREGKFSVSLPSLPKTAVEGRLTECGKRPLSNQAFTLALIWEGGEIKGFVISVPGYEAVTVTKFSRLSIFGLTRYLLGEVCLKLEIDELPWSPDRPLTWDDFKGQPPDNVGPEAAFIRYRLSYQYRWTVTQDPKTGKWRATVSSLKVTNTMVRSKSWVDPARKTDELLKHEQGHFDINEVYRRILEQKLKGLVGKGDTAEEAADDLNRKMKTMFDKVWKKAEEVQKQYDNDTEHGQNVQKQRAWEQKIRSWLRDPSKAPQP